MPEHEWRRSGAHAWRGLVATHVKNCFATMWSENLFAKNVAGLLSVTFVEASDDEDFLRAMALAERSLGDNPPTHGYRLMQFTACLKALRKSGTLGRAEIPFEASGKLEDMAKKNMGLTEPDDVDVEA